MAAGDEEFTRLKAAPAPSRRDHRHGGRHARPRVLRRAGLRGVAGGAPLRQRRRRRVSELRNVARLAGARAHGRLGVLSGPRRGDRKIEARTPWWKRPAWWWTRRFGAWPFTAEWLSAAFDYNVAPFFQSFVEVKVERSANRVRLIPYGVHGRLTWGDFASSSACARARTTRPSSNGWCPWLDELSSDVVRWSPSSDLARSSARASSRPRREPGYVIAGRVVDPHRTPAGGGRFNARPREENGGFSSSPVPVAADGSFVTSKLRPGTYVLEVVRTPYSPTNPCRGCRSEHRDCRQRRTYLESRSRSGAIPRSQAAFRMESDNPDAEWPTHIVVNAFLALEGMPFLGRQSRRGSTGRENSYCATP